MGYSLKASSVVQGGPHGAVDEDRLDVRRLEFIAACPETSIQTTHQSDAPRRRDAAPAHPNARTPTIPFAGALTEPRGRYARSDALLVVVNASSLPAGIVTWNPFDFATAAD